MRTRRPFETAIVTNARPADRWQQRRCQIVFPFTGRARGTNGRLAPSRRASGHGRPAPSRAGPGSRPGSSAPASYGEVAKYTSSSAPVRPAKLTWLRRSVQTATTPPDGVAAIPE